MAAVSAGPAPSGPLRAVLAAVPLLPLALFALLATQTGRVAAGGVWSFEGAWAPSLGVTLSLRLDGLGLLFGLLITGTGVLITWYANQYLAGHPQLGRFQLYLLAFMVSMLGVTSADNLILLFVFWELTSLTSFLLIGFNHEKPASRDAALQALLVTSGGGLVLLAGVVLLGLAGGTFRISELGPMAGHALYAPILATIAIGAFTKSAQVPFHFWLPSAMEAPTPVSAYLHSATMVKAGVYLLARLHPTLGGTDLWFLTLVWVGAATMLTGAVLALRVTDLKRILAYSTITALGMLVLLLGVGTTEAIAAAMVLLLAHVAYKASLFLLAGAIEHDAGTREVDELGGLGRRMPLTAATAAIGALGLAGFGPVLAFIAKEMLLTSIATARGAALLIAAVVATGAMLTSIALLIGFRPFWSRSAPSRAEAEVRESRALVAAPLLLAVVSVVLALFPRLAGDLLTPAAAAVSGESLPLELHLWHGIGLPLILSIVSVLAGFAIYAMRGRWNVAGATERIVALGPSAWYGGALAGVMAGAERLTGALQSGLLRSYLLIINLTALALVALAIVRHGSIATIPWTADLRVHEVVIAVVILAAALAAVRSESRLGAVASLGVVGYAVALIYILYSAPDLAMTQFLVETLMVILFVLVIYHLPRFGRLSHPIARARDAVIAIAIGAMMTAFVLVVASERAPRDAAEFYAASSYTQAYGRNIVNVILVDFRALDTAGEITVLAVAAVGVFALLKMHGRKGEA